MKRIPFEGFELASFWENDDYYTKERIEPTPTPAVTAEAETELGYKLH